MDSKEFIGKKIKEFRKKRGISQLQLAEMVELSDKHIGRIEAGLYSPNITNFLKIIKALDISFSDFNFSETDSNENPEKAELLRLINLSNEKDIQLYLNIIKLLKEND